MTPAKSIIAERAAEHMPKPAHNMFATEVVKALDEAGYIILAKSSFYRPDLDDGKACDVNG